MPRHYDRIIEILQEKDYTLDLFYGQTVYKVARNGYVYFRYSKKADNQDKYFFGIEEEVIEKLKRKNFFIIFTCGSADRIIVLPGELFLKIAKGVKTSGKQWKVNIFFKDGLPELKVTGKERMDVSKFLNNLDLVLSNIVFLQQEIPKEKPETEQSALEPSYPDLIKKGLRENSRKSDSPKLFEKSISVVFASFGFECKLIGDSGDTDILITKPYLAIVDGKSTARNSLTRINFTRLKQHKLKNSADYKAVVSVAFDPAVQRDAEIEQTTLFTVDFLCELIDLVSELSLNPWDLKFLFEKHGEAGKTEIEQLKFKHAQFSAQIKQLYFLLESVDSTPKTLLEIKGRYDLKTETAGQKQLSTTEIERAMNFLSLPAIDFVRMENGKYFRLLDAQSLLKKFSYFGRTLLDVFK